MSRYGLTGENFKKLLDDYAVSPSKQLNLGYTVTKLWILGFIIVGILTLLVVHVLFVLESDYKDNNKSKTTPTWLAIIFGVTPIIIGLVATWMNFYSVVDRINTNPEYFNQVEEGASAALCQGLTSVANKAAINDAVAKAARVEYKPRAPPTVVRPCPGTQALGLTGSDLTSATLPEVNPFRT